MAKPDIKTHAHIPEPRRMVLPKSDYQPRKAAMEAEMDMPGLTEDQVRSRFFRPFRFEREGEE